MAQRQQAAPAPHRAGCWGPLRWGGQARAVPGWAVGGSVLPRFPVRVPRLSARHGWMGNRISFGAEGWALASGRPSPAAPWAERGSGPLAKKWRRPNLQPESLAEGLGAFSSWRKGWPTRAEGAWLRLPGPWPASHRTFHPAFPTPGGAEGKASSLRPPLTPPPPCLWSWWVSPGHSHQSEGSRGGGGGVAAGGVGRQRVWGGPCTWGPWAWRWGRPSGPRESTCERKLVGG